MTVESQPKEFPRIPFIGIMGMRVTPIDPRNFAGLDPEFASTAADKPRPAQTKEHILPKGGAALDPISRRRFQVPGAKHRVKEGLGLRTWRVKIGSKKSRLSHAEQDSIVHALCEDRGRTLLGPLKSITAVPPGLDHCGTIGFRCAVDLVCA